MLRVVAFSRWRLRRLIMKRMVALLGMSVSVSLSLLATTGASTPQKSKQNIREVCRLAHAPNGLLRQVTKGAAVKQEAEQLRDLYYELGRNKPPAGEVADWRRRVGEMINATTAVIDGEENGRLLLTKAANCFACHKAHKP
jgi:hypothetical protein